MKADLPEALLARLRRRRRTLSVAESCSGGRLCAALTAVPGASRSFLEGIVAYSNGAKVRLLGVRPSTLRRFGAVSEETAREMAVGALRASGSDYALSVTGIAGPSGGTKGKPVGLVCFSLAGPSGIRTETSRFQGDRCTIQERSARHALIMLLRLLPEKIVRTPRR